MAAAMRFCLVLGVLAVVAVGPFVEYRAEYAHHKRLREVDPGILYRSGQLTTAGFRDAVAQTGARLIINCQDEFPDPELWLSFWNRQTMHETELCRELGVKYAHLEPDVCFNRCDPTARPRVIDQFLDLMDDPGNRPVLLHCKAGLHRTGILTAVYRMEYDGWDPPAALAELKANGFGDVAATAANDYIRQYVLDYRVRGSAFGFRSEPRTPKTEPRNP